MKESEVHLLPAFLLLLLSTCFGFNSNALVVISVNGFVGDVNVKFKFIYKGVRCTIHAYILVQHILYGL